MLLFDDFQQAISKQFASMSSSPTSTLYKVALEKEIQDIYLSAIPEEDNPIYKTHREYDCAICKHFLLTCGSAVTIEDNKIVTIFGGKTNSATWNSILQTLSNYVKEQVESKGICGYWYSESKVHGVAKTFQRLLDHVEVFEHLFVNVPPCYVKNSKDWATINGEAMAIHDVFTRSLSEISNEALSLVIELEAQNSLYRANEFISIVKEFAKLKKDYDTAQNKELFIWHAVKEAGTSNPVLRLRNTAIGTLLTDLSQGKDLDIAVSKYESIMAPLNYKRPNPIVTQKQISDAEKKIEELGLLSSFERRHAQQSDLSVNDVLFVDREVKPKLSSTLFSDLAPTKPTVPKTFDTMQEVTIDKFIQDILPTAQKLEVLVENKHIPNLVSLIAPITHNPNKLFKWDNEFSWIYNGSVSDSIKQRVKAAGGNINAELCCRLSWHNYDDLDLHLKESTGFHIYYGDKCSHSKGQLDVDMNAGGGRTREPVENIFYSSLDNIPIGESKLFVNMFSQREKDNGGFEVEIELKGTIYSFSYNKPMNKSPDIIIATINKTKDGKVTIVPALPTSQSTINTWGISTQTYIPVELMCYSPNYWGSNKVGNKHYIFALKDCKNPEPARGFLNEYIDMKLDKHRKVFELLGSKTMVPYSNLQVSGLGFSSTIPNELICRVTGATKRLIKIKF